MVWHTITRKSKIVETPLGYIQEAPERHSSPHLPYHSSAPLSVLSSTGGHPALVFLCGRTCEFSPYLTHPKAAGIANNHLLLLFKIASGWRRLSSMWAIPLSSDPPTGGWKQTSEVGVSYPLQTVSELISVGLWGICSKMQHTSPPPV